MMRDDEHLNWKHLKCWLQLIASVDFFPPWNNIFGRNFWRKFSANILLNTKQSHRFSLGIVKIYGDFSSSDIILLCASQWPQWHQWSQWSQWSQWPQWSQRSQWSWFPFVGAYLRSFSGHCFNFPRPVYFPFVVIKLLQTWPGRVLLTSKEEFLAKNEIHSTQQNMDLVSHSSFNPHTHPDPRFWIP